MEFAKFAKFKTISILPAFAAMPGSAISDTVSPSFPNAEYSLRESLNPKVLEGITESSVSSFTITQTPTKWTKKMSKRFEELAILEAVGKITPQQKTELEALTENRRALEYPRSPEEIFWEYKQRQLTS